MIFIFSVWTPPPKFPIAPANLAEVAEQVLQRSAQNRRLSYKHRRWRKPRNSYWPQAHSANSISAVRSAYGKPDA